MNIKRPKNLPDFTLPPLNELVMAVQFEKPKQFSDAHVGHIWSLYRDKYPICQQQPSRPPNFETFGAGNTSSFNLNFGPPGSRYLFSSEDGQNLLQYQSDILVKNWKTNTPDGTDYPRFENIIDEFSKEFNLLDKFHTETFQSPLSINQAELTYVNILPLDNSKGLATSSEWINFLNTEDLQTESIATTLTEVIRNEKEEPIARLIYTCHSASGPNTERALKLDISFRGAPSANSFDCAKDFLSTGRKEIVKAFVKITTSNAHELWGRVQ